MRAAATVRQAANAQVPMADYLPLGTHIAPDVIRLANGQAYLATWRLDGVTFETQDPQEIAIRKEAMNQFLRTLADGQWSLWSHKVRRRVHERLHGHYDNPFCRELIERYYDSFNAHRQMSTELYLTLVYRPERNATSTLLKRFTRVNIAELRTQEDAHLVALADAGKQLEAQLKAYTPQRLTTYTRNTIVYSVLLFAHKQANQCSNKHEYD